MRKWLAGLLLITALLPLLAWFTLPWTGQYLLREWLLEQGFTAPALILGHPSWNRFTIDHITVSRQQDGQTLSLDAQNIQLSFDPRALLRGQIKELRIDQVQLSLSGERNTPSEDPLSEDAPDRTTLHTDTLDLSTLEPGQWFRFAPSDRLVIAQLKLDLALDQHRHWKASGNIDIEPELLQTRLALQHKEAPLGYLDMSLTPNRELGIQLTDQQKRIIQGQYLLAPGQEHWQINTQQALNLTALKAWLPKLGLNLPDATAPLDGNIALGADVTLPTQLPLDPKAMLDSIQLTYTLDAQVAHAKHSTFQSAKIGLNASGALSSERLSVNLKNTKLQVQQPLGQLIDTELSTDGELQLNLINRDLTFKGQLNSPMFPATLSLSAKGNADALRGRINFSLPSVGLKQTMALYRPWLPTDLKPLELHQGNAEVSGWLAVNHSDWHLKLTPQISNVNLSWNKNTRVEGLSLQTELEVNQRLQLNGRGSLEIDHTDSGLRIFGPQLDFNYEGRLPDQVMLSLSPFSLSVLDGIIALPAMRFNPAHPVVATRVAVAALDLQDILALYPQEGLYGSGVLGGELPIRIDGNQVEINNGKLLSSAEGGIIRYKPTPEIALMGAQNPGVKLALGALTDLRFELLDLSLDYSPNGDTLFRARLKGHNPDWQQGRPIDLNLNIEENLLDLWRTLQLTDRITDSIDRRFQH